MSNIKLSKNILDYIFEEKIKKIKIFFYESGCSGKKLDIAYDDFNEEKLVIFNADYDFLIYVEKLDENKLKNSIVTKTVKADHTGKEKIRYIFSSDKVEDRCGCGSSFAFEKKVPKLNLENLANLKNNFKK